MPAMLTISMASVAMRYRVTFVIVPLLWLFSIVTLLHIVTRRSQLIDEWTVERTDRSLDRAREEIQHLQRRNEELNALMRTFRNVSTYTPPSIVGQQQDGRQIPIERDISASSVTELSPLRPSLDRELRRRELEDDISEYMMFIKARLRALRDTARSGAGGGDAVNRTVNRILADGFGYQKALSRDLRNLRDGNVTGDTSGDNKNDNWRRRESFVLAELVQKRLIRLQNPANCSLAKKLVCSPTKACGYGCQLHYVTYCLLVAYATERTLVMQSLKWNTAPYPWQSEFLPLSNTCTDENGPPYTHQDQVVHIQFIDYQLPRPEYLPPAVPDDLADIIMLFHAAPAVWWIGQFVKYLTRPQPQLHRDIEDTARRLGFSSPIVGIQIRRTDKVKTHEATKHELAEYMEHVEDWFHIYESDHTNVTRRVYIATDDPAVLEEAHRKYPGYKFIIDKNISTAAADANFRFTKSSLHGVILDIYFLSRSDFLVCTFSSNVCRVAYELMQTLHGDASMRYKSLDDSYYYQEGTSRLKIAIYDHVPESTNEIELRRNDVITFAGNHWDGYSMGTNQRTGTKGIYPSYKVRYMVKQAEMPKYEDVT